MSKKTKIKDEDQALPAQNILDDGESLEDPETAAILAAEDVSDDVEESPESEGQSGPATATPVAEVMQIAPVAQIGKSSIQVAGQFPTNSKYLDAKGKEDTARGTLMNELVVAYFIENMKGCVGIAVSYDFVKSSEWLVPRWFAVSHPTKIVIRG